jgi:hypothetical protein
MAAKASSVLIPFVPICAINKLASAFKDFIPDLLLFLPLELLPSLTAFCDEEPFSLAFEETRDGDETLGFFLLKEECKYARPPPATNTEAATTIAFLLSLQQ